MIGNAVTSLGLMTATILSETPVTPTDVGTMFSGIDFSDVMGQILSSAPILVPVVVACMAFRKGLSFAFRLLRRA